MALKKTPTLDSRIVASGQKKAAALATFDQAAASLEAVAAEQEALADEATAEAQRLARLALDAAADAAHARRAAEKVRDLTA